MQDILQEIVTNKRLEVEQHKKAVDLDLLAMNCEEQEYKTRSMRTALAASSTGIIAEFKRKSPSKGWLFPMAGVDTIIPSYAQAGASACSILTDGHYFGGSLGDLQKARQSVDLPLLRKDFIIDPYQLFQSRVMGADAILLIASCLTPDQCFELAETAHQLQMEVLLEIHHEEELGYLNPFIDMLGVNNRHLGTFNTDIQNSFRLIEHMQAAGADHHLLFVAESGISDPDTVSELRTAGFRGFLIGETFMKTGQPGETLSHFISQIV